MGKRNLLLSTIIIDVDIRSVEIFLGTPGDLGSAESTGFSPGVPTRLAILLEVNDI